MLINDKVDAVYIPDSPSRIKATDYNQIKNEIQECITEAGLTPTKDVIQLPQALKILTAQSGAEEVAKIEAAGKEQLDAVNAAGETQTGEVNAAGAAQVSAINAVGEQQVQLAKDWASKTSGPVEDGEYSAKKYAQDALQNSRGFAIGTVYYSQSSLATDNPGALPLWTGEYYANGAALYPDFYAWVKRHTELCTTKADYDARLAQYGEVPFYVVDEAAGSLRLPKRALSHGTVIKEKKPTEADPTWYRQWSDGWLEQGGIVAGNGVYGLTTVTLLKPYSSINYSVTANILWGADWYTNTFNVNAQAFTDAASIPANYTTTSFALQACSSHKWEAKGMGADGAQEDTLYPWVAAYNAAVPASTAQAAEFQQGLLNKISKTGDTMSGQLQMTVGSHGVRFNVDDTKFFWIESNAANGFTLLNQDLKGIYLDGGNNGMPVYTPGPGMSYAILHTGYKNEIVGWSMPNYAAGIELPAAAYTAPKDGLFVITISQKVQTVNQKETTFYINGNKVAYAFVDYQNNPVLQFLLSKGDVLSASVYTSWLEQRFFPFKGAN